MTNKIPVYILAGGQSSRFGGDKALADMHGRPMIARVAEQWTPFATRVVVVADRADKYVTCGLTTIADRQAHLGPIGGLVTALEDCGTDWLLLTACDAMLLDPTSPHDLLAGISEGVQVVAWRGAQWQTMPALYHSSVLPAVKAGIAAGQRSLWRMIERVPHKMITLPLGAEVVAQINSRADLQAYLERI